MTRRVVDSEDQLTVVPLGKRAHNFIDRTGHQYNDLTVISYAGKQGHKNYWNCLCKCGKYTSVASGNLVSAAVKSCGCGEIANRYRHGLSKHPLYQKWGTVMNVFYNPKSSNYKHYGGKGLVVHQPWHDPETFVREVEAEIGLSYGDNNELSLIDKNKNFEPKNIRWANRTTNLLGRKGSHHHGSTIYISKTYRSWSIMITNMRLHVCNRWRVDKGGSFENFLEDMGVKPEGTRFVRIDKTKPYSKDNCEWRKLKCKD